MFHPQSFDGLTATAPVEELTAPVVLCALISIDISADTNSFSHTHFWWTRVDRIEIGAQCFR